MSRLPQGNMSLEQDLLIQKSMKTRSLPNRRTHGFSQKSKIYFLIEQLGVSSQRSVRGLFPEKSLRSLLGEELVVSSWSLWSVPEEELLVSSLNRVRALSWQNTLWSLLGEELVVPSGRRVRCIFSRKISLRLLGEELVFFSRRRALGKLAKTTQENQ